MAAKTYHVFQSDGAWTVKKEGAIAQTYRTQREAIKAARTTAKRSKGGQLVIHARDGRIREHETYGMAPSKIRQGRAAWPSGSAVLSARSHSSVCRPIRTPLPVSSRLESNHVFINRPFDPGYRPILNAILFARCALDEDASEFRLSKIERIIEESRYGINDLSAVALDVATGLPQFNMPLELGLFFGCKRFGPPNQSKKRTLVLDHDPYRYRQFISDISGQAALARAGRAAMSIRNLCLTSARRVRCAACFSEDISAHGADPERAIRAVRDWLQAASKRKRLAGAGEIIDRYRHFQDELAAICAEGGLEPDRLTFVDLSALFTDWLRTNR